MPQLSQWNWLLISSLFWVALTLLSTSTFWMSNKSFHSQYSPNLSTFPLYDWW